MAFSATDAAFEGFRLARQHPKAMGIWALASLVISLVSSLAVVGLFGGALNQMMAMDQSAETDPAQAMALIGQMGLLYLLLIPISLIIFAIFAGAVYRAVLRPSDSALGFLRLGATELRLALVMLVLGLLAFAFFFVAAMVMGVMGAIVGVSMAGAAGGDGGAGAAIGMVGLIILIYIVVLLGMLAFGVKFSLSAPMTFAEGRIRIFESWNATKGRFWPLFGCYLLAGVLAIVVSLLGGLISMAIMMALGGAGQAGNIFQAMTALESDYTSLATFFTPAVLANMVVSSIFSALTYAIWLAPAAVAYREIVARNSPALAETFR